MTHVDYLFGGELPKKKAIQEKINILHDFAILKRNDPRENDVKDLLKQCTTEQEMTTLLHDVLRKDISLDTLLHRGIKYLRGGN